MSNVWHSVQGAARDEEQQAEIKRLQAQNGDTDNLVSSLQGRLVAEHGTNAEAAKVGLRTLRFSRTTSAWHMLCTVPGFLSKTAWNS